MFKSIDLQHLGINIHGEYLSHLRFADDIVIIADSIDQAKMMIQRLNIASRKVRLKINFAKTQLMTNLVLSDSITVDGVEVKKTTSYKYLGHEIRIHTDNQTCEIPIRIGLAWAEYGKLKHIFRPTDVEAVMGGLIGDDDDAIFYSRP